MTHDEFILAFEQLRKDVAETLRLVRVIHNTTPGLPKLPANDKPTPQVSEHKCPLCNGPMFNRLRRSDGMSFFGCAAFPKCNGTRDASGTDTSRPARPPLPAICKVPLPDDEGDNPRQSLPF